MTPTWLPVVLAGTLVAAAGSPPARVAPEWAVAVLPSGDEFALEIAADPGSRARGYMYRERVGPREGMLFVFDRIDRHSMWMKHCKVPLDIVWLDDSLRVVDIAHDLKPCPDDGPCPGVAPMRPARYVLELAAGVAGEQRLEPGDPIQVLSEPALVP